MSWRNVGAGAVLLVGLTQMTGELLGHRMAKGFGAVTVIAPCPKVFCDMGGFEPFAAEFTLTTDGNGGSGLPITPELYSRMRGPYNRRNVYGAAIAASPLLPEPIRSSVLHYGFAPEGPLRRELGIPGNIGALGITVQDQTRGRRGWWFFTCWK